MHSRSQALLDYKDFRIDRRDEVLIRKSEESTQVSQRSFSPVDLKFEGFFQKVIFDVQYRWGLKEGKREKDKRNLKEKVLVEFFRRGKTRKFKNDKKLKKMKNSAASGKNNRRDEHGSMKDLDKFIVEEDRLKTRAKRISLLIG
jgi:hypothetical protein